jgi:hypothetical protein
MMVLDELDVARAAIDRVFESLGRYVLFLDENFRIVHAPPAARELLGAETARPIADLLGKELFGPAAPLRDALAAGERREGWRALLQTPHGICQLTISAAPCAGPDKSRYVVMILPDEDEHFTHASPPSILAGLIARSPAMSRIFQGPAIQPEDLPAEIIGPSAPNGTAETPVVSEVQRLRAALETHRWRREETAHALGISRATLWRRMRALGLL